jgi:hypothetical protein
MTRDDEVICHGGYSHGPYGPSRPGLLAHNPWRALDHGLYFRERTRPHRSVAIVGQPYAGTVEQARASLSDG